MLFTIYCRDKANSVDLRMATRPDHVTYLKGFADKFVFAGPLLADDGETPIGSVLVIDVEDKAAAEAFAAGDPYAKAGLFAETSITGVRQVFPPPA